MTIIIQQNSKSFKKSFKDLDIGNVFLDSAGDYHIKIRITDDRNAVALVTSKQCWAGMPLFVRDTEKVTPVQFNVKVSPL